MPMTSRTRSRNNLRTVMTKVTWSNGSQGGELSWPVSSYDRLEHFEDYVTDNRTWRNLHPKDRPATNCFHEKHAGYLVQYPSWVDTNTVTVHYWPNPANPDWIRGRVPLPPDEVQRQLALEAFNALHSQVPEQVSMLNFLWELRDIKGLLPKMERSLIRTANGLLLGYQFGWKPFLADLRKLGSLVENVQKRLTFLRDSYGKRTRVHFRKPWCWEPSGNLAIGNEELVAGTDPTQVWIVLRNYSCHFTAGGLLYHTLKGLESATADFRALATALGLNNPTKIVWNAIPYSFVVDWFARVNTRLDQLASQPFEGEWRVENVSCSFAADALVGLSAWPFPAFGNPKTPLGSFRVQVYRRYAGLPVGGSDLDFHNLSSTQQMLLGSLLLQRSRLGK